MKILVLNSGSSSQKSFLYELGDKLPLEAPEPLWAATIEWDGDSAEVTVARQAEMSFVLGRKLTRARAPFNTCWGRSGQGNRAWSRSQRLSTWWDIASSMVVHITSIQCG